MRKTRSLFIEDMFWGCGDLFFVFNNNAVLVECILRHYFKKEPPLSCRFNCYACSNLVVEATSKSWELTNMHQCGEVEQKYFFFHFKADLVCFWKHLFTLCSIFFLEKFFVFIYIYIYFFKYRSIYGSQNSKELIIFAPLLPGKGKCQGKGT